jgi:hypothetical protein
VEGTRLLKPGLDGIKAWMIDITWPSAVSSSTPVIKAELLNVKEWPADPELKQDCAKAYSVLDPLRHTQLAKVPQAYRPLSSYQSRARNCSMATYLLSRIRDAMNMDDLQNTDNHTCDVALMKGGSIRGGRDYADDEHITLEVLQSELEEAKEIVIVQTPGFVIKYGLRETWQKPNAGWFQYDDGVVLDADGLVTHIGGKPVDMSRAYKVATIQDYWRKSDGPTIGSYFEVHPELIPEPDSGRPIHSLLIRLFAMQIWAQIWHVLDPNKTGSIDVDALHKLDATGDGKIKKADIKAAIEKVAGFETFAGQDVMINTMLAEMAPFRPQTSNSSDSSNAEVDAKTLENAYKHWSSSSLASLGGELSDSD